MGVTGVFNCAGVNKEKFLEYTEKGAGRATYQDWSEGEWEQTTAGKENHLRSPFLQRQFDEAKQEGLIRQDTSLGGSWSSLSEAGEATNLNLVHVNGIDCTDVADLTKAEMKARADTMDALQTLKHKVPGFEDAKLRNFGMTIGVRDSRKIVGRHNLTHDEVFGKGHEGTGLTTRFPDAIGTFPEFIDGYAILILPTTGRYFQVPYGCTLPADSDSVENLLVAGRCVAGDKTSHAAMRNMMACTVTGQGAGVAAAIAVQTGTTTSAVDIGRVQAELRRQGVKIE